jgi:hypothetical protein
MPIFEKFWGLYRHDCLEYEKWIVILENNIIIEYDGNLFTFSYCKSEYYTVCPQSPFGISKNCGVQTN